MFICVLTIFFILAIPITIYNQKYYMDLFHRLDVLNLVNMIIMCINCLVLIVYSIILLKKEFSYKKTHLTLPVQTE